jgi:hypothetical protein
MAHNGRNLARTLDNCFALELTRLKCEYSFTRRPHSGFLKLMFTSDKDAKPRAGYRIIYLPHAIGYTLEANMKYMQDVVGHTLMNILDVLKATKVCMGPTFVESSTGMVRTTVFIQVLASQMQNGEGHRESAGDPDRV